MFMVWFDPSKSKAVQKKVDDALDRYIDKFDALPEIVLTNPVDAAELRRTGVAMPIEEAHYIQPNTFYLGAHEQRDGF